MQRKEEDKNIVDFFFVVTLFVIRYSREVICLSTVLSLYQLLMLASNFDVPPKESRFSAVSY